MRRLDPDLLRFTGRSSSVSAALAVAVLAIGAACGAASQPPLDNGTWYGKILRVEAAAGSIVFVPVCKENRFGDWRMVSGRARLPRRNPVASSATLVIFRRVPDPNVLSRAQRVDLQEIAFVVLHGRRPTYFPGWWLVVKGGKVVSIKENAGIAVKGTLWARHYRCIYDPRTVSYIGTDTA